jgi:transposase
MQKLRNSKLTSKMVVLKCTRNLLRCTNSRCKATFWNRDVNAARNILGILSARLLAFERIPAFAR